MFQPLYSRHWTETSDWKYRLKKRERGGQRTSWASQSIVRDKESILIKVMATRSGPPSSSVSTMTTNYLPCTFLRPSFSRSHTSSDWVSTHLKGQRRRVPFMSARVTFYATVTRLRGNRHHGFTTVYTSSIISRWYGPSWGGVNYGLGIGSLPRCATIIDRLLAARGSRKFLFGKSKSSCLNGGRSATKWRLK